MRTLKQAIQEYADINYAGSFRHMKEGVIKKIQNDALTIMKSVVTDESLHEPISLLVHCYMKDVFTRPTCRCGTSLKFNTTTKEFALSCSYKCRGENEDVQIKKRNTNIAKYGNHNVLNSDHGREKGLATNLDKYGVSHYTKTEEYRERLKSGDIVVNRNPQKVAETHMNRYYNNLAVRYPTLEPLFTRDEYMGVCNGTNYHTYECRCKTCSKEFPFRLTAPIECPKCKPKGTRHERDIAEFLDRLGVKFKQNDKQTLKPEIGKLEIDILVNDDRYKRPIGIEVHGLYWHSDDSETDNGEDVEANKYYHLRKTLLAEEVDVDLIQIFDDEMYSKKQIVFNRLKSKLGLVKRKIYARKCIVREITYTTANKFLTKYHIQGTAKSTVNLGLYKGTRLVAVMTFCMPRTSIITTKTEDDVVKYELLRYATIANFSIVGGAGKLLKHFTKTVTCDKVYSYADRRWSSGGLYKQLGFTCITGKLQPNYWYTRDYKSREHRSRYQKHMLASKLPIFNPDLSEYKNMRANKYKRLWDCGTLKFELDLRK